MDDKKSWTQHKIFPVISTICYVVFLVVAIYVAVDYVRNAEVYATNPCYACERDFNMECLGTISRTNSICTRVVENGSIKQTCIPNPWANLVNWNDK